MTLQELIQSGKKGRVVGSTGRYELFSVRNEFSASEVLASYEVSTTTVTLDQLAAAWDSVRPTGGSVAASADSAFFKRIAAELERLHG